MKVYIVTRAYNNFEDWEMNYSEVNGVFYKLDKAKDCAMAMVFDEIHDGGMKLVELSKHKTSFKSVVENINYRLNNFKTVSLLQKVGEGETVISIIEEEVE